MEPEIRLYKICENSGCRLIYGIKAGSHLYGTTTPESDEDYRGVFVPGVDKVLGFSSVDVLSESDGLDIMLHEIRKFAILCLNGNPNILDWLFAPDDCVIFNSDHFDHLRINRDLFLSRKLMPRFYGYVKGHLSKMERGVTRHLGEKRKADIDKHGYSTKNALHLIRLARMGCEAIETGKYNVRREDADELLAIRRGEWDLARINEEGNRLLGRMESAVSSSPLPEEPDTKFIEDAVINILIKRIRISERFGDPRG